MASIRKRTWESGGETKTAWVADYFDQKRKRHIKTFPTRKEADAWLVKTRGEVQKGTHTPESSSCTVTEAAELWLKKCQLEGLERTTIDGYRGNVELHIIPLIGHEKLAKLTTVRVKTFSNDLRDVRKLSNTMARKVLVSFKSILKEAHELGLVAQNVATPVNIKVDKRSKPKPQIGIDIPTKDEVRRILDAAKPAYRPLFVTAVYTGMRASELRGLIWDHVDFDKKEIHVRQRADKYNEIGSPKSEAGYRKIPIGATVVNTLKEWKLGCPKGKLKLVFPSQTGTILFLANIWTQGLAPVQIKAGVVDEQGKPKYGFHSLRHFYASWIAELGFSMRRAQELLGHSSIVMTQDTYTHLFPSEEDDHAKLSAGELSIVGG